MSVTETTRIHPTAIVAPSAEIGEGVEIGPYSIIEAGVRIGAGTLIHPHVIIEHGTRIGSECEIFSGAVLGGTTYFTGYPNGVLYAYDPSKPWTANKEPRPDANPRYLGNFADAGAHYAYFLDGGDDPVGRWVADRLAEAGGAPR